MTSSLRILYYNWVDYLDEEGRGGGVTVYQRNLMAAFAERPGVEVTFLSAGVAHDLRPGPPRWEPQLFGLQSDQARRYEIVNSAVLAPAHHGFGNPAQLSDPATEAVFFDFIDKTGPYDVVHFNNLEGLPAAVLKMKERWPQTRVLLSLHNYYPFCPQVNLWHQERETCDDFDAGRACVNCLPHRHDARHLRLSDGMSRTLKKLGLRPKSWAYDRAYRWSMRFGGRAARAWRRLKQTRPRRDPQQGKLRPIKPADGSAYVTRRREMVALINAYCDRVLCVSDAVRRLALVHGLREEIVRTSYIGTREASAFARTAPRDFPAHKDGTLTLAYLGYMRRDKGFYFLLKALEEMPAAMAARLRLEVAARRGDRAVMGRLKDLAPRLAGLTYADGYAHDDLDRLLRSVDVGLVPVLWHDNLPQVAIEMHARHIPLLTADMGGAQELGGCAEMVFRAGDIADFHKRIAALLAGDVDMAAYWQGAMTPPSMTQHLEELMGHYRRG